MRGCSETVRKGDLNKRNWGKSVRVRKDLQLCKRRLENSYRGQSSRRQGDGRCCLEFIWDTCFFVCRWWWWGGFHQTHCRAMLLTQRRSTGDGVWNTRDDATVLHVPADEEPGFSLVTVQRIQLRYQLPQQISWWAMFTFQILWLDKVTNVYNLVKKQVSSYFHFVLSENLI